MKKLMTIFAILMLSTSYAKSKVKTKYSDETEQCLSCHMNAKAFVYYDWKDSKHAKKGIGCYECHGAKVSDPASYMHYGFRISTIVTPKKCAKCHKKEVKEHVSSLHGKAYFTLNKNEIVADYWFYMLRLMGYKNKITANYYKVIVKNNPAVLATYISKLLKGKSKSLKVMGEIFNNYLCIRCHGSKVSVAKKFVDKVIFKVPTYPNQGVGRLNPDGSVGSCANCHPFHSFSLKIARSPEGCSMCHKYATQAYKSSIHYAIFKNLPSHLEKKVVVPGKDYRGPTCATCHMSKIFEDDLHTIKYPSTHDPARISAWKLLCGIPRKKGNIIPGLKSDVYYISPGKYTSKISVKPSRKAKKLVMKYDHNFEDGRVKAMAVCMQCHTKQWTANYFVGLDQIENTISKIQWMLIEVETALKKAHKFTAYDYIKIRSLFLRLSRLGSVQIFHESPSNFNSIREITLEINDYLNNVKRRIGIKTLAKIKAKYLN